MSPFEKIEHLFVPALRLCFATGNSWHPVSLPGQRTIHCTRFCSREGLRLRRQRLRFNKKAAQELFAQAVCVLQEAKACHDGIEEFYKDATDFSFLEKAYQYLNTQTRNAAPACFADPQKAGAANRRGIPFRLRFLPERIKNAQESPCIFRGTPWTKIFLSPKIVFLEVCRFSKDFRNITGKDWIHSCRNVRSPQRSGSFSPRTI